MKLLIVKYFAAFILLMGIVPLPNEAQVPKQAQIAFCSDRDGDFEIYIMDPDGSNLRKLTNNSVEDYRLAWSPDGQKIAFCRGTGFENWSGDYQIYVMDRDGKYQKNISDHPAVDLHPSRSPDGRWISLLV